MKAKIIKWNGCCFVGWDFDTIIEARDHLKNTNPYYVDKDGVRIFAGDRKSEDYLFNNQRETK